jgi:hypothetical protein
MLNQNGGIIGPANIPTTTSAKGKWSLAEYYLAKRQNIWPAVTPNNDPYFEYTTLLLPGNGTNGAQNNTFLDGSTNNFTITRNGNTTQGTFSPFSQTGWGNYFDGSGDYLTATANAAYTLGTNNHTIECWFYLDGTQQSSSTIFAYASGSTNTATNSYYFTVGNTSGALLIGNGSGGWGVSISFTTPSKNTWHHLAIVRNGNVFTLYIDGVSTGTPATYSANITSQSSFPFEIGGQVTGTGTLGSTAFKGYISNFRVVNGTAVYTGAFTPPTSPLTAVSGTVLLTCQSNRFIDNSTNNFTITKDGDTRVVAFSPFNPTASWSAATYGGSGYFDGSGDYLNVVSDSNLALGTGDFTIEMWMYPTLLSATFHNFFDFRPSGTNGAYPAIYINNSTFNYYANSAIRITNSTIPTVNAWNHIALVRSGTTTKLYLNGSQVGNDYTSDTTNYLCPANRPGIGSGGVETSNPFPGYLSNIRILKGTALYTGTTYTVPTAPLTAITNTSLLLNCTNAGIYDATSKNDLETVADAQISNTTAKWGSTSIKFDGTGDYLTNNNASNSLLAFGTGDFTIEGWFYSNNASSAVQKGMFQTSDTIGGLKTSYTTGVSMNHGSTGELSVNVGSTVYTTSGASITTGAWFYFAITRSSGNVNVYVNGVSRASGSGNTNNLTGTYISVGGYYNTSYLFDGYLQDFRITKGYARTITTPTAAFPTL